MIVYLCVCLQLTCMWRKGGDMKWMAHKKGKVSCSRNWLECPPQILTHFKVLLPLSVPPLSPYFYLLCFIAHINHWKIIINSHNTKEFKKGDFLLECFFHFKFIDNSWLIIFKIFFIFIVDYFVTILFYNWGNLRE